MCGRFALHHPNDEIHERFHIPRPVFLSEARFNIAPTQTIGVVQAVVEAGRIVRAFVPMKWGLVPRWSKDGKPFINARGETLAEKPSFRAAFQQRRIIVPCSGFYEWQVDGKQRLPKHIRLRGGALFGIAAIWEPGETPTAALITVAANAAIRPLHERMPAILTPADEARWLDPAEKEPETCLRSYPAEEFEVYSVSTRVNGVKDDDPGLIVEERRGLFG
jgi:putative SOS response-associated peptidase YedK